jgi:hypothetical protein
VSTPSFTVSLENWAFALPAQRVETKATSASVANFMGVLPIDLLSRMNRFWPYETEKQKTTNRLGD